MYNLFGDSRFSISERAEVEDEERPVKKADQSNYFFFSDTKRLKDLKEGNDSDD